MIVFLPCLIAAYPRLGFFPEDSLDVSAILLISDLFAGVTCTNNFMNASNFKACKSWVLVFSPEDLL